MDDKIAKRMKKNNKKKGAEVNLFGDNQMANNNEASNKMHQEDEDEEYIVESNVTETNVAALRNDKNVGINDNIWEEGKAVEFKEKVPEEPVNKKKVAAWGDSVVKTDVATPINAEDLYFPGLDDPNAKKHAPKPKKQANGLKNPGLFAGTSLENTAGSTWAPMEKNTNKFEATDGAIRFTNSKGGTENLNKFQTRSGPVYDATLGDDSTNESEATVVGFKGKVKIGSEVTEADIQREKYLQEVTERAAQEEHDRALKGQMKEEQSQRGALFTNSKGTKNNGLFMSDTPQNNWSRNGNTEEEQKPRFTNSKKVNNFQEPQLDPNVPTVSKNKTIVTQVSVKGWD
jgi:hypothetical protein